MRIKILEYLIVFAIILSLIVMGLVIKEILQPNGKDTLLSLAGLLIGLTSFLITAAIRYSDIVTGKNNNDTFKSISDELTKIKDSISKIELAILSNTDNQNKIYNEVKILKDEIPRIESSLFSIKFITKKEQD